jgi:transposase
LDNNKAEQALKTPILNRKNAYFYKSSCGALVGSILMSVIRTCIQSAVNPVQYLVALQKQAAQVRQQPDRWLPWNWRAPPVSG